MFMCEIFINKDNCLNSAWLLWSVIPKIWFEKVEFNIGENLIGVYVINLNGGIPLELSLLQFAQIQILP